MNLIYFILVLILFLNVSNKIILYLKNKYTIIISTKSYYKLNPNEKIYFHRAFCLYCKKYLNFYYYNPFIFMIEYECDRCKETFID